MSAAAGSCRRRTSGSAATWRRQERRRGGVAARWPGVGGAGADRPDPPHVAATESSARSSEQRRRSRERRDAIAPHDRTGPDEEALRDADARFPVLDIDPRLAKRRAGSRSKDPPEAHEVLERIRDAHRRATSCTTTRAATSTARGWRRSADLKVGAVRHRDRAGAQGRQASDAPPPDDGHRHALRRDRAPRPHVLQPALAREPLQGGTGARRVRRRDAVPRPPPAREPGGRAPPRRRRRPDPHRADHPRAPGVGGHHHADDPRVGPRGARAAPAAPRPAARPSWSRPKRSVRLRPGRSGGSTSPQHPAELARAPGAAEVRRAVHAGARRGVPQAPGGGRADRRGPHGGGPADRAARGRRCRSNRPARSGGPSSAIDEAMASARAR